MRLEVYQINQNGEIPMKTAITALLFALSSASAMAGMPPVEQEETTPPVAQEEAAPEQNADQDNGQDADQDNGQDADQDASQDDASQDADQAAG